MPEAVGEMNVILVQSSTLLSLEVFSALGPVMVAYIPLVHGTTLTAALPCRCTCDTALSCRCTCDTALPCRCTCGAGHGSAHPTEQIESRTHPERPCWGKQTFLIVSLMVEHTVKCVSWTQLQCITADLR